jgi:hypothetical protein
VPSAESLPSQRGEPASRRTAWARRRRLAACEHRAAASSRYLVAFELAAIVGAPLLRSSLGMAASRSRHWL